MAVDRLHAQIEKAIVTDDITAGWDKIRVNIYEHIDFYLPVVDAYVLKIEPDCII